MGRGEGLALSVEHRRESHAVDGVHARTVAPERRPDWSDTLRSMSEEAIRRTLAEYCQALDDGRFDEWAEVFTDDVRFEVMDRVLEGIADVRSFIEAAQGPEARGRHMLSEPLIQIDQSGDTATAMTDYAFISQQLRITSAGRYHDTLVQRGGRWRISSREIVFLGGESSE